MFFENKSPGIISLPKLGTSLNETTVSGFSSGGYMTAQMAVIHSDLFSGAGIVAGGPYACVQSVMTGDLLAALQICVYDKPTGKIDIEALKQFTQQSFADGKIADPKNLKDMPVWIYSGILDSVVLPPVVDKSSQQFTAFDSKV